MKGKKLLTLLLTQWAFSLSQPLVAKAALLCSKSCGDEFTAAVVRAVVIARGDWRAAADFLDDSQPARNCKRIVAFRNWAAEITKPTKRGLLLEWKGGAL